MKFINAVCLIASLAIVASGASITDLNQECGPFEVFKECGTACPEHCPMINNRTGQIDTGSKVCTKQCVPGCFCAEGYVRDIMRKNECVPRSGCSAPEQKCGLNQVFKQCGTACPEHCPMFNPKTGELETGSKVCTKQCVQGCFCAEGYVRDIMRKNECVPRSGCSAPEQKCGPNMVFKQCDTACPEHCPMFNQKTGELEIQPKICTKQCVMRCACAEGYVRDLKSNECVLRSSCPAPEQKCGPNMVFKQCDTACPEHCPMYNPKTGELETKPKICTDQCVMRCACAEGYVRDIKRNNECVPRALCSAP